MGSSATGILFYGYFFEEEEQIWLAPGQQRDDWGSVIDLEGQSVTDADFEADIDAALGTTSLDYSTRSQLREELGVSIVLHSYRGEMYGVVVCGTRSDADWGESVEITTLEVDPSWDEKLRKFCELMRINVSDKKPAWHLCAYYG